MFPEDQKTKEDILEDEELFTLSLKNPVYFDEIVNRYKEVFLRKALSFFKDSKGLFEAPDVVQETFVKIYIKGSTFNSRGKGSFKAWAYSILLNNIYSALRKLRRENTLPIEDKEGNLIDVGNLREDFEDKISLDYAIYFLSKLPKTLKDTANLYFFKGKDYKEISLIEGHSEGSIRTKVHRIRSFVKREVKKDDDFLNQKV